jgi:hypothetical protein
MAEASLSPWQCACGGEADVLESRKNSGGSLCRRRRCSKCGARWTTYEIRDPTEFSQAQILARARLLLLARQLERQAAQIIQQLQPDPNDT